MSRETNWDILYKSVGDEGKKALDEIIEGIPENLLDFVKKFPPGTPFHINDLELIVMGWKEIEGLRYLILELPNGERINGVLKGLILGENYIEKGLREYVARMGLN